MKRDSRLSGVLHVLLHLAGASQPVTSAAMAGMMATNPVVIRRILAGLREQGMVTSEKGHGGGWRLAADPETVTLHDIYVALDSPAILAMGNRTESPGCLVEAAVNQAMTQAFAEAEAVLLRRLREVTLAELRDIVYQRAEDRHSSEIHDALLGHCPREPQESQRV